MYSPAAAAPAAVAKNAGAFCKQTLPCIPANGEYVKLPFAFQVEQLPPRSSLAS